MSWKNKIYPPEDQSGDAGRVEIEDVPRHSGDEEYERAYRRAKEVRCRMISKGILRLFISI